MVNKLLILIGKVTTIANSLPAILQLNASTLKCLETAIIATWIKKNCSLRFLWAAKGTRRMKNDWRTSLQQKKNNYWKSTVCLLCTKVRQCYKLLLSGEKLSKLSWKSPCFSKNAFCSTLSISYSWGYIIIQKYKTFWLLHSTYL